MDSEKIRLYICEDSDDFAEQLTRALPKLGPIEIVGRAREGGQCVSDPALMQADVLLLDLEMPGRDGLWVIGQVAGRGPEILVLTSFADEDRVFEALRGGAAGYLVKGVGLRRLTRAIGDVASGGTVIEPALAARFWNLFLASIGRAPRDPWNLTDEEKEVLTLVGKGLSNPEIGSTLGKSRSSVKRVLESVYTKMAVHSRVEAVTKALAAGVIEL